MSAPEIEIPTPQEGEDEDVQWALSTAATLHSRGEWTEAVRWLRKAASAAADTGDDARSVELFTAAADVAARAVDKAEDTTRKRGAIRDAVGEALARMGGLATADGAATDRAPMPVVADEDTLISVKSMRAHPYMDDGDDITLIPYTKKAEVRRTHDPSPVTQPVGPASDAGKEPEEDPANGDSTMTSVASFRVAVLSDADGMPRLLRLNATNPAPEGAATAVLIPTTADDAAVIRRLLGDY